MSSSIDARQWRPGCSQISHVSPTSLVLFFILLTTLRHHWHYHTFAPNLVQKCGAKGFVKHFCTKLLSSIQKCDSLDDVLFAFHEVYLHKFRGFFNFLLLQWLKVKWANCYNKNITLNVTVTMKTLKNGNKGPSKKVVKESWFKNGKLQKKRER